jgi:hypothetical protein
MTDPAPETGAPEAAQPAPPKRFLFLRRKTQEDVAPGDAAESAAPSDAPAPADAPDERVRPGVLRRRRRQIEGAYQQAVFDLGGLAMELHGRGLLAEDVMRRKAAEVADLRAQLNELGARLDEMRKQRQERRQAGRRPGVTCEACGARSVAGANFCATCGAPLVVATAGEGDGPGAGEDDQVTTVISVEETVVVEPDPQPTAAIPPAGRDGA